MKSAWLSRNHQGFTLLEVMIAMSIFAIMGVASYQLLSGEIRTQERLLAQSERQNHWQRSMMRMSRDLQQLLDRGVRLDYGDQQAALVSDGRSLQFTRGGWSNPIARTRSNLQRLEYRLEIDADSTSTAHTSEIRNEHLDVSYLQRQFWPHLDRAPGSEPIQQKLFTGVEDIRFRFFHTQKRAWFTQWPESEDQNQDLPQAIEITLINAEYGYIQRVITYTPTTAEMTGKGGQR